jgi:hypothetical protein
VEREKMTFPWWGWAGWAAGGCWGGGVVCAGQELVASATEKRKSSKQILMEVPLAAKAHISFSALMYGLKPVPFTLKPVLFTKNEK